MKILLLLLLTLSAVQAKEAWPPKPFTHVVAYCYDYIRDPRGDSIVFKKLFNQHHLLNPNAPKPAPADPGDIDPFAEQESP